MSEYDKESTTLQGVSTLLAFPQWYLNERLSDLLENGSTPDGKSLSTVRLAMEEGGDAWLSGTVSALGVSVHGCSSPLPAWRWRKRTPVMLGSPHVTVISMRPVPS